ncbi:protein fantom isoform X2 [Oncorhynchus mykiss]|uniref:protein fantom isoform X2 n=1 Tax=Oncorhynchus mykiss TaxID=8022 RepID=UPI001878701E|nr:protein fantom isoform X2 [Oncorhynchus mykiss]
MSLTVDETAGDLPVRDVGLMRGGLMPTVPDSVRDGRSWKKLQVLKLKDRQRVFQVPREQLEDQCFRLQEENNLLRQHTRTQEQRLRRMSTKLMRLREGHPGEAGTRVREGDMEDMIQELEARVATLESQKGALQSKLSMARQHIMDLGPGRSYHRLRGRGLDGQGGVTRAAQTAPPRYGLSLEDTRGEIEKFRSSVIETQKVRVTELEQAAQSLRDTLGEKEREIEDSMKEMRRQQANGHRITIKDNVDVIRLQKHLSDKSAALRVSQEKFNVLQEAYEAQLEEGQRSLKESQGALLEKVEELSEQLKQERQRALTLEGQLTAATLSMQALKEFQERVSDLEGEKNLLKDSYDTLLESTLSAHSHVEEKVDRERELEKDREREKEEIWRTDIKRLEEILRVEREERGRLEEEKERLQLDKERIEEQQERERESVESIRGKHDRMEQEVLQYRQEVTSLQERLDSVTKEFDMSVEDLSETLIQIKTFRLQQEGREGLRFLGIDGKVEDSSRELRDLQASQAETVLELQKTRDLLLLQHRINNDLQAELNTMIERAEREREETKRRVAEKEKLLGRRVLQINTLQAQLKELAYSPRNYKRSIPLQYTWPGWDQEVVQPIEDDTTFSQLRAGESLLEIHLRGAAFTPGGLRTMGGAGKGAGSKDEAVVTFCTYALLDFEMHSTPLVSGGQPNYGFTSKYPLSARDLGRLGGQGGGVLVELHQALGGVRFVTRGGAQVPLVGAVERRGEQVSGRVNIAGSEGDVIGILDFRVRLFPPSEPVDTLIERGVDRMTERGADRRIERGAGRMTERGADRWIERGADRMTDRLMDRRTISPQRQWSPIWAQRGLGLEDSVREHELFDYGRGIPNELEVVLEHCVGLSARWPELLPDSYLMYRLYDLPPHASPTIPCSADPLFNDTVSYPLAVTTDVLEYLRGCSLWVYVFDDNDDQTPPAYLAKTPIPLRPLAAGRPIRGDYVLRDTGGGRRGMVRVFIRWIYPFQPPEGSTQRHKEMDRMERAMERRSERAEELPRPIAKPRVKSKAVEPRVDRPAAHKETSIQPKPRPPPIKLRLPQPNAQSERATHVTSPEPSVATPLQSPARKRATPLRSPATLLTPGTSQATPSQSPTRKQATPLRLPEVRGQSSPVSELTPSRPDSARSTRSSASDDKSYFKDAPSLEQVSMEEEEEEEEQEEKSDKAQVDSEVMESRESRTSNRSDVLIIPPSSRRIRKGDKLRVEILSLSFEPTSRVALDESVQRVYVEYRLLGVPMETTETPMSLRKPSEGEEIHYNFTRVIYVDGSEAAPLRQYLYTMLEGTDPNQGRLKFTVVNEPMDDDDDEECTDVGHAFLDLQELLLTGNDITERQIDIVSVDVEKEVMGKLKVSLEAAKTLTGIYWDYRQKRDQETKKDEENDEKEEDKEQEEEENETLKKEDEIQVIDYDIDDDDSDFY